MRVRSGVVQYALLIATVAVVVAFLLTRTIDVEQHNRRLNLLLQLHAAENELDRDVLRVTSFILQQYDSLTVLERRIRDYLGRLGATADKLGGEEAQRFTENLDAYTGVLEEKLVEQERIKSTVALVRNGLHYLPLATAELHRLNKVLGDQVWNLLNELYRYNLFSTELEAGIIRDQFDELEILSDITEDEREALENVLLHMRANLDLTSVLSKQRANYVAAPSSARFDALYRSYTDLYVQQTRRSNAYTLLLVGLAVALFLALGLALRNIHVARIAAEHAWIQLRDAVESLSDAFALFAPDGRLVLYNHRYQDFYPWLADRLASGLDLPTVLAAHEAAGLIRSQESRADQRALLDIELPCREGVIYLEQVGDGRWYRASDSCTSTGDLVCIRADISKSKQAEEQLRMSAAVFETTTEGILVTGADKRIKTVNPAFTRITGYTQEEVVGQNPRILSSGRHDAAFYASMWTRLEQDGCWMGEVWNRHKDGSIYPERLSLAEIRNPSGQVEEYVAVFSDISQRKRDEEQIRRQANFDGLTGLPNRTLLFDRVERALSKAQRDGSMAALLFIDLDRFKGVNDTLGHIVGDRLLQQVAARLVDCVRDADTVARFGGDEFVVLLGEINRAEDAATVAEKVISGLSAVFELDERDIFVGASVGITLYPVDARDAETLLRNADMAMYRSKDAGRNTYRFFTRQMNREVHQRMDMERELRQAVTRDELRLLYQPIVRLDDGKLIGAEALLRWHHPRLGEVPPSDFIPLAEETGLIGDIGRWILREACKAAGAWRARGMDLRISINLSSRQLSLGLEHAEVLDILRSNELPCEALTLEITEGLILDGSDAVHEWLNALHDLGVRFAVDDFGTGYSSLSYLKRFPMDSLKIDRSFIQELPDAQEDASLVRAILSMADSLDMTVVAEGIETRSQAELLRSLGCELAQGFLFSRPLEADQITSFALANHRDR